MIIALWVAIIILIIAVGLLSFCVNGLTDIAQMQHKLTEYHLNSIIDLLKKLSEKE